MNTVKRYKWKFEEIPENFLSTKYYDHYIREQVQINQNATYDFPDIDSRAIIDKWAFILNVPILEPQELPWFLPAVLMVSLRLNHAGVPGYNGVYFSINSWIGVNPVIAPGNTPQTPHALIFNVPIEYPIRENQTPVQVRVQNLTGVILRLHCRIRAVYID